MNGYKAFYRTKQIELYADTAYQAQQKAAQLFKAKREWEVTVILCETKDGTVIHNTGGIQ